MIRRRRWGLNLDGWAQVPTNCIPHRLSARKRSFDLEGEDGKPDDVASGRVEEGEGEVQGGMETPRWKGKISIKHQTKKPAKQQIPFISYALSTTRPTNNKSKGEEERLGIGGGGERDWKMLLSFFSWINERAKAWTMRQLCSSLREWGMYG
ncbi:hypothetical protein AVEN_87276-1 [Araneus ventricosus]|uniref:Uncharacterized protein n=1 Tax=Araneus ventricosus TaxID=182803 RepID=A0A4Y2EAC6_ARAVE|nr:hypothetical protein AVEN_87276-1 [Araneus ventricosus]